MVFWEKKIIFVFFCAVITGLFKPVITGAFGISPPQVINDRLFPGAYLEQQITLSRTDSDKPVNCKIEYNIPGFEDWIAIDPGLDFIIPAGERVSKIKVKVTVPKNAKPSRKKGNLRITVAPQQEIGKVNIVLGAQIDIDLTVTDEKIGDFLVRQVKIPDLEAGWKVIVIMKIENKGNIDNAPDKVALKIYDSGHKNIIQEVETKKIQKIKPFKTEDVLAFFKTPLPVGQYWGEAQIYKNGEIVWEEKAIFTVREKGTLPPQPKEPLFINIDQKTIILAGAIGILLLLSAVYLLFKLKSKKQSKKSGKKNPFSKIPLPVKR